MPEDEEKVGITKTMKTKVGKNLLFIILGVIFVASAYIMTLPSPPYSHYPFYVILLCLIAIFLLQKNDAPITDETEIRERFVNTVYGKQAGFKPLKSMIDMTFQRTILTNPFDKEKIVVWYFFNKSWVDIEVYKGEYKATDSLDSLLLMHRNHLLIEKSIDSIDSYIRKAFLSGGIREAQKQLAKFGLRSDKPLRHRITTKIKQEPSPYDESARVYAEQEEFE